MHGVVANFFASAGQAALPAQFSARSHSPAAERQTMLVAAKASAGQVPAPPVQVSTTSQTPADERQVAPAVRNVHDDVQHEVVWPFAAPRSQLSPAVTSPSPQTCACATDQPSPRDALSSSTLPLHVIDRTVADAPPAV